MEFRLLGPLEVLDGATPLPIPAPKQRALLALLLLHPNRTLARDRIVDDLWGDAVPASAPKMVQIYVSQLRKLLPEPRLRTRPPGYALDVGADELDLTRFERLLARGREAVAAGRPEEGAAALRDALALWRGPALAEFPEPFARLEAARLEELRLSALEWRVEADLAAGRHGDVVAELEALTARHPLRERFRRQQMLALYRTGRHAEALAAYQTFRRALADELGIEPTAALRELERRILRQDPELDPDPAGPPARGLPRTHAAEPTLLEREAALAALAGARERAGRGEGCVVFVTGEPGIGKTSLLGAFLRRLEPGARVLVGTCDSLSTPRPLGPIRDLAGAVSPELEAALATGAAAYDLHALLLAELAKPPRPTVLALEDVHWADDATCDAISVVGRRIGSLPAAVVLTFRAGEVGPGHPLHAALAEIRAADSVFVELEPLSEAAVASLAGGDADRVYGASGGNPFFVTELLASRAGGRLPPSVATAVVARAARLDGAARRLVELVSVVPGRVATSVLDAVMPDWAAAAEEPERRLLLEVDPRWVRFRHELARGAIEASIPSAARRRLHTEILRALLAAGADPAEIVHHAEAAGADDVVAGHALAAARRAAAVDSNREAYAHYRRAAEFGERLGPAERATVLEELAAAAYAAGRGEEAVPAIERAIAAYSALGDEAAVGRCTRASSRFHWFAGDGAVAHAKAHAALAILEPLGETVELARALATLAQLAMLRDELDEALAVGGRALELAERLGDERIRAHAAATVGTARVHLDPAAADELVRAHAAADALGEREEATRALGNLGYSLLTWARPAEALRYTQEALAYAQEHEVHGLGRVYVYNIGWLQLRAGKWDEAERSVRAALRADGRTIVDLVAQIVLTELAVRRGDPDAHELLADTTARAYRTEELQRIGPLLELAAECALTTDAPMPVRELEEMLERFRRRGALAGSKARRLAAWAAVAGIGVDVSGEPPPPYAAMRRRDWRAAADGFGEIGWPYDRALMLSLLDDEQALTEAAGVAQRLGAAPLAARAAGRLAELRAGAPPAA